MQERILERSSDLFMRLGIRSVTMDDIARELSVSKKTIYQYFKDKDDLVHAVTLQYIGGKCDQIHCLAEKADDAVHQLILLSQHLRRMTASLHPSLMNDMRKYHPNAWKALESHRNKDILGEITANLERGRAEGLYRNEIQVDLIAKLRMEQVNIPFNTELFPPDEYSISEVQIAFMDHFIHGIVSPKGLELFNRYIQNNN